MPRQKKYTEIINKVQNKTKNKTSNKEAAIFAENASTYFLNYFNLSSFFKLDANFNLNCKYKSHFLYEALYYYQICNYTPYKILIKSANIFMIYSARLSNIIFNSIINRRKLYRILYIS